MSTRHLCAGQFGIRPDTSKHHIRVCTCLVAQFVFFSRADSGILLTSINAQASSSTLSLNQSSKNVAKNQATPSSRVSSTQDDPDNYFNQLHLHWKMFRAHPDTDLCWSLEDDPVSWFKNSGIFTEYLLLLLVEINITTTPGAQWTVHSLRRDGTSVTHTIDVSITVIMSLGLWKSLVSELLYINVSVWSPSEVLFFFGHLLSRFNQLEAPVLRRAPSTVVSSSIDLSDTLETLLEIDGLRHHSPLGQLLVVLINNCSQF